MTTTACLTPPDPAERVAITAARVRHAQLRALQTACIGLTCGVLIGVGLALGGIWVAAAL